MNKKDFLSMLMIAVIPFAVLVLVIALGGCGKAKAGPTAHAESIGGPPGVTCYAIMSGDQVVGGNCIR